MRLSARFDSALVFASQLHAEQVRKGTEIPYISHLLAVSGIALENGADEDEAIAALLHDAVEDQGGAGIEGKIRRHFGDRVANIVKECTDAEVTPKPPWRARKEAYLDHLPKASSSGRLISASDKLHNARAILHDLREIGKEVWKRFKGGEEGSLWYYKSLVRIFCEVGPVGLGKELGLVVTEIEKLSSGKN